MTKYIFIVLSLLFSSINYGQCPSTLITLTSQTDIDNFVSTYPGCTSITNGLVISGSNISDLSGLSMISFIGGGLTISNNSILTSLTGMSSLNLIFDGLTINNNILINDISELEDVTLDELSDLSITGNSVLGNCSISLICDKLVDNQGAIDIADNDSGCNNEAEVYSNCVICPSTSFLTLATQAEIDNFATIYPNCTNLSTSLDISGNDITNLFGLAQIQAFDHGYIRIQNNPNLQTLDGLGPLDMLGVTASISIISNPILSDISSLQGSTIFEGRIDLRNNPLITSLEAFSSISGFLNINIIECDLIADLSGLESITEVNRLIIKDNATLQNISALSNVSGVITEIEINSNPSLTNIDGLEGFDNLMERVWILNNPSLTNLNGLSGLQNQNAPQEDVDILLVNNSVLNDISGLENIEPSTIGGLFVYDNLNLSKCDISSICDFLAVGAVVYNINNNAVGCNSDLQILEECSILDVPDLNFLNVLLNHNPTIDTNEDGFIQYTEAEEFNGTLQASSSVISDFTGVEGFINIIGFEGGNNEILELRLMDNTNLTSVVFENNTLLQNVNIKNGNNNSIINFQGLNCANLQFICVDDVAYAVANFINVDPQTSFIDDCSLSISEFDLKLNVLLYPNPVSKELLIRTPSEINVEKVEIYSVLGKKLKSTNDKFIQVSDLLRGVYFVIVITNRGKVIKRIIKE